MAWTFQRAQEWLAGRRNVPTVLSSRGLALAPEFPARAKAQAFFSARVSSAHILEALREQIRQVAGGDLDVATARLRLKTFLGAQGFPADDVGMTPEPPPGVSEEDWRARKELTNLASTRRLDLVVRQNTAMAHAVGRREVSLAGPVLERWPYFRYIARQDGRERPEHGRLHNLVLPKTDPFWRTHTPPWDYNCRCDIEDADQEEAEALGGVGVSTTSGKVSNRASGEIVDGSLPNESGYTFDVDAAMSSRPQDYDWGAIEDAALREKAQEGAEEIAAPAPVEPAQDSTARWMNDATAEEKDVVGLYQSTEYRTINEALRSGGTPSAEVRDEIAALDRVVAMGKTGEERRVYRGSSLDWLGVPREAAAKLNGTVVRDQGFMSTALDPSVAEKFASYSIEDGKTPTIWEIRVPKGTAAADLSQHLNMEEAELLLGRGTKLRITGVDASGSVKYGSVTGPVVRVYAEVIR